MSTKKVILLTCVLLLAGVGVAYAFRKRNDKPGAKKTTVTAGEVLAGETSTVLKRGSDDEQHVTQLQQVLNVLHKAAGHINKNCGGIKWAYMPGSAADGSIVKEDGNFNIRTAAVSQYYLNREEVDLEYLDLIRKKVDKYKAGDKCVYPLGIPV